MRKALSDGCPLLKNASSAVVFLWSKRAIRFDNNDDGGLLKIGTHVFKCCTRLLGTVIMFIIISCGLLVIDWRMGLCIILPVPTSALVVLAARKKQIKAEERNLDAHRAAYDSVQEYLDVMKELRSDGLEKAYLEDVDKKLEHGCVMCVPK